MNPWRACYIFLLISALALTGLPAGHAAAQAPSPAPYWPTSGWRAATPEQQGIDSVKLAEALEHVRKQEINIHSLLIVRNGYVVLDAYFYPYSGSDVHDVASVTKSVTASLVGIAVGQGKISSVKQPVLKLFPERKVANVDARKQALEIRHLLAMSSGLECDPKSNEATLLRMKQSGDWAQFMLDLPMAGEPGRRFVYCSGGVHLLSGIISKATGVSALDYARLSLFGPLGIRDATWPEDPQGISHGWGDLHLHPRDMAKVGYLWLNRGVWDGRRVISADWVADSTRGHAAVGPNEAYGYGWWVRPKEGLYEALGRGGQRITVLPAHGMVVVFTGGGFEPGDVGRLLAAAIKSDRPLPENRAGVARLKAAVEAAALPPAPKAVAAPPATAAEVSGKTYVFGDNPVGLRELSFTFPGGAEASVRFAFADARFANKTTVVRPVGLDGVSRISPDGRFGLPVGLQGYWEDARTFVLDYDEIANINVYRFGLKFDSKGVSAQLSEKTGTAKLSLEGKLR